MKNIAVISIFLSAYLMGSAQNISRTSCSDFYRGEFKNINDDNISLNSTIIRNGNKQLEITNGNETYKKINWINDCDYKLFFVKKETKKNRFAKFINKNEGIKVTTEKIEGNTIFYKTSYFDGEKNVVSTGRMIKISNDSF